MREQKKTFNSGRQLIQMQDVVSKIEQANDARRNELLGEIAQPIHPVHSKIRLSQQTYLRERYNPLLRQLGFTADDVCMLNQAIRSKKATLLSIALLPVFQSRPDLYEAFTRNFQQIVLAYCVPAEDSGTVSDEETEEPSMMQDDETSSGRSRDLFGSDDTTLTATEVDTTDDFSDISVDQTRGVGSQVIELF